MINPILNTDSYKTSHYLQYPPGIERLFSYIESRGGVYDRTVFFGLQAILLKEFVQPVTAAQIEEAAEVLPAHGLPFNREGWQLLIDRHGGRLPIEIRAVAEGSVPPTHNALVTVINTDPDFFWLTTYVETALLRVWYPTTVATISWHVRQDIRAALEKTADDPVAELPFKLHDFGARGVSSEESAALGGLSHLVNFKGSDTLSAVLAAREFYDEPMAAYSIPAAEHSTVTSWGRDGEIDAYENMIDRFGKPGGLFAVVSDSYDIYAAVEHLWGGKLRSRVIESGATLVIRPDSGDPAEVVAKTLHILAHKFGSVVNRKGYKVLKSVRVIQGDGVNPGSIKTILDRTVAEGFCASNLAFGMGGALLQQLNRDTQKFAFKASAARIGGRWRDVFKDPVTDPGKRSKRGLLGLTRKDGNWATVGVDPGSFDPVTGGANLLTPVYRNGQLIVRQSLADIRRRAETAGEEFRFGAPSSSEQGQ